MNVAELSYIERLILADVGPRSEFGDTHADKRWSEYDSLARRVIAAEKLVEELHDVLKQEDDHWAGTKAALATYEATK